MGRPASWASCPRGTAPGSPGWHAQAHAYRRTTEGSRQAGILKHCTCTQAHTKHITASPLWDRMEALPLAFLRGWLCGLGTGERGGTHLLVPGKKLIPTASERCQRPSAVSMAQSCRRKGGQARIMRELGKVTEDFHTGGVNPCTKAKVHWANARRTCIELGPRTTDKWRHCHVNEEQAPPGPDSGCTRSQGRNPSSDGSSNEGGTTGA